MSDTPEDTSAPRFLGQSSPLPASPEEAELDYVPNPRVGALYMVRFSAPEFTSLCPVTGQPDFAHLVIDYAPGETFTAPAVPLDPPPAGVKSMSGFERYCEPPKPPPRILRPREAPPQLVVAPPAGQAMAKMRPRR